MFSKFAQRIPQGPHSAFSLCKLFLHFAGNWGGLTHLDLSGNLVQVQGAAALEGVLWPNLQILNLSHNCLQALSFWALSTTRLPLLVKLNIQDPDLLPVFTHALVSASWPKLTYLNIMCFALQAIWSPYHWQVALDAITGFGTQAHIVLSQLQNTATSTASYSG